MAQERKCQVIKIENVVVSGWEAAIRGMRNPMNSWSQSDSHVCNEYTIREEMPCQMVENDNEPCKDCNDGKYGYCVGKNDFVLMRKLSAAGTSHRKYLRFITVTAEYHSRKCHRLDEWCDFCRWIETLPYSEVITGERDAQAPEADGART